MESILPATPKAAESWWSDTRHPAKRFFRLQLRSKFKGAEKQNRKLIFAAVVLMVFLSPLPAAELSPAVKLAVAPKYPTLTLEGRISGQVRIRVVVDRAGDVKDATVEQGHPMLREAALEAARRWKFAESSVPRREAALTFNFVILSDDSEVRAQTIFLPPNGVEIRQRPTIPLMQDQGGEFPMEREPVSRI